MAAWSVQDVRNAGPDTLVTVADGVIQYWIDQADLEIDARVYGTLTKSAGVQLTLHKMLVAGKIPGESVGGSAGAGAGAVTGITVGSISVQYANGAASGATGGGAADAVLGSTKYGAEFIRLRDMKAGGPWLAGIPC